MLCGGSHCIFWTVHIDHGSFYLWPLVWDTLQKVLGFCVNIILIKCKCIVLGALRTYLSTDMYIYVLRLGVEF